MRILLQPINRFYYYLLKNCLDIALHIYTYIGGGRGEIWGLSPPKFPISTPKCRYTLAPRYVPTVLYNYSQIYYLLKGHNNSIFFFTYNLK